jgi:3-mercaptopyruvate sulfurtransferase SseA
MPVTTRANAKKESWNNLPETSSAATEIQRITGSQLIRIIGGKRSAEYDIVRIIDCRSTDEYIGGHIRGAINRTGDSIQHLLFSPPIKKSLLVLYCEFSELRAPKM